MEKQLMTEAIVLFDLEASNREEVIAKMVDLMEQDSRLINRDGYYADVLEREGQSSTAVGIMTATPHAKSIHVKHPSLAFARLKTSILWDENENVEFVFLVAVPKEGQGDRHLEILAALFRKLIHDDFRDELKAAEKAEHVVSLIGDL